MVWKLLVGDEPAPEDLAAADVSMAHVVTSVKDQGSLGTCWIHLSENQGVRIQSPQKTDYPSRRRSTCLL